MNIIYQTKFGSHLYGTNTPTSDNDQKAIFLPSAKEILLQRAKEAINDSKKKDVGELDIEYWSLQKFLKMCGEGQAGALEVLFSSYFNDENLHKTRLINSVWAKVLRNKNKFLNKKAHAFVGYCRQQASRYGLRGDRVKEVREVLDLLNTFEDKVKLSEYSEQLKNIQNN